MATSYGYAWEKFYVAVGALASATGTIQERLLGAYVNALMRLDVLHIELPRELAERFKAVSTALTQALDQGEGAVAAITDEDASKIASEIVSLYDSICRLYYADSN